MFCKSASMHIHANIYVFVLGKAHRKHYSYTKNIFSNKEIVHYLNNPLHHGGLSNLYTNSES